MIDSLSEGTMDNLEYDLESECSQFYTNEGKYSGPMKARFNRSSPGDAESWLLEQYGVKCTETGRKVAILRLSHVK